MTKIAGQETERRGKIIKKEKQAQDTWEKQSPTKQQEPKEQGLFKH